MSVALREKIAYPLLLVLSFLYVIAYVARVFAEWFEEKVDTGIIRVKEWSYQTKVSR